MREKVPTDVVLPRWPSLGLALVLLSAFSLSAATRTWTGTAGSNWSDANNWGGTAPVAGDDLVFPAGASNLTMTNDFAAGTAFRSMTFDDAYTANGNAIVIGDGGITHTSATTTAVVVTPLTLGASQTWTHTAGVGIVPTLRITGATQLTVSR